MSVKNPIRSNVIKSESQYAVEERVCQEATIGGSGRLQRANTSDSCRDVDIEVEEKEVQRDEKSKAKASTPQEPIGSLANENGDNESAPASFDIVTNTDGDGWQTKVSEDERNIAIAMEDDDLATKSGTDTDSDTEWEHLVSAEDKDDYEVVSPGDISQAKFVMRNITSRIPLVEETAIRRSVKLVGPPLEFARTHSDEFAQKFRWPQHARNLRNTNFSQDPIEIMEDFELSTEDWQSGNDGSEPSPRLKQTEKGVRLESAFAQVPRPMVALAANALCTVSQKRKRSIFEKDGRAGSIFSASALLGVARTGERFGDHFVGSLLRLNGKALQGIDSEVGSTHDRRCWSSLPTKKKPIANWRFILERVESFMGGPEGIHDAVNPPIKPE
ncbi:unnamed protein product [Hyaloperonospora brassicae]|nr:unnamed protein product [Hyaloperonospora brassicae]